MIFAIALAVWTLAALPIAIALFRLCSETGTESNVGAICESADADPGKPQTL